MSSSQSALPRRSGTLTNVTPPGRVESSTPPLPRPRRPHRRDHEAAAGSDTRALDISGAPSPHATSQANVGDDPNIPSDDTTQPAVRTGSRTTPPGRKSSATAVSSTTTTLAPAPASRHVRLTAQAADWYSRLSPLIRMALWCACGLIALYLFSVWTPLGQRLDDVLLHAAWRVEHVSPQNGSLNRLAAERAEALSRLWPTRRSHGEYLAAAGATLALVIGLVRRQWRAGLAAFGLVAAVLISNELLKKAVLGRPDLFSSEVPLTSHNSFPAGNTSTATALVLALILVAPPGARRYVARIGGAWAGTIAISTVVTGWHRVSDNLGSALLALGLFCVAAALARPRPPKRGAESIATPAQRRRHLPDRRTAILAGVAAIVLSVSTAFHPGTTDLLTLGALPVGLAPAFAAILGAELLPAE
jgi:membrane-associated phospholipid phosphatase